MITNKKNAWRSCNSSKEELWRIGKPGDSVYGGFCFYNSFASQHLVALQIFINGLLNDLFWQCPVISRMGSQPVAGKLLVKGWLGMTWFVASAGQKRELSGVSISSPKTIFPSSSRPNSNLVSAMMMPLP